MKHLFTILACLALIPLNAQNIQTATLMQYNLLNYRNNTGTCSTTSNNPTTKEESFKAIVKHVQPDIICANEIGNNFSNANELITNVFNTDGVTKYKQCNFTATSGSGLTNMLFYNNEKFGLEKQDQIEDSPGGTPLTRLIDVYYLYFRDPNLSANTDTTRLVFFVAHLKAGTGSSNQDKRNDAAQAIMQYLQDNNIHDNYFLAGDLNLYSANEDAYQELTVTHHDSVRFYDPINASGSWNNNSNFAFVHTQSTRSTSTSCFTSGGMDDRFDFILMSEDVKEGFSKVEYINNSYRALGQDGNRFNGSISSPTNSSEPTAIINALYKMSDHLPVLMNIAITETEPNSVSENASSIKMYINNPVSDFLKIRMEAGNNQSAKGTIYSITGNKVLEFDLNKRGDILHKELNISNFKNGIYLLKVSTNDGSEKVKKLLKI